MAKSQKHRNLANPELAQAMRELGRSSACQRHTVKKHKGTKGARARQAIREYA